MILIWTKKLKNKNKLVHKDKPFNELDKTPIPKNRKIKNKGNSKKVN